MKTVLLAKSSSGKPYEVEFLLEGDSLRVFCHCKAGVQQQVCKHKPALLKGDMSMLFDPTHSSALSEIHASPQFGMLKLRVEDFERVLGEVGKAKGALAKKEKDIKATFGHGLLHGFI